MHLAAWQRLCTLLCAAPAGCFTCHSVLMSGDPMQYRYCSSSVRSMWSQQKPQLAERAGGMTHTHTCTYTGIANNICGTEPVQKRQAVWNGAPSTSDEIICAQPPSCLPVCIVSRGRSLHVPC